MTRRLTSKCFVGALSDKIVPLLAPLQIGVSMRGGCEAAAHAVKEALKEAPDKWLLRVDLSNAFNSVDRSAVLEQVESKLPECLAWATTCYGAPSHLQFGKTSLSSTCGLHQGCPLSGHLYGLAQQPILEAIEAEVPSLDAHVWYHDDGNAVGTVEELAKVVDIVRREGPRRGLHLSAAKDKSTVWSASCLGPGEADPLQRGIPRVEEAGVILLGTPVGSTDFVKAAFESKLEKIRSLTSLLSGLHQPHVEFVLLRSCLALPKIVFLLRTTDTSGFKHLLAEFDRITREALSQILGGALTDQGWDQAKLPVSMGGVGLRAAEDHASAAYATSLLSSLPLCRKILKTTLTEEEEAAFTLPPSILADLSSAMGDNVSTDTMKCLNQKSASLQVDLNNSRLLSESFATEGNVRETARLASVSQAKSHCGDWLNVIPSPGLGLLLRPPEFVASLRYRLGHPIFTSDGPCPACRQHSDRLGDHAMNCAWQGERISRHNSLRDTIHSTAVSAGLGPTREGRFLLPGQGAKPADVLIPHWTGGKDTALDVTVINPLQAAEVQGAATTPGNALTVAHERKMTKSWAACNAQGIVFTPLAAESLGAWHPVAIAEVVKLGKAYARHTGEEEQSSIQHLFQRLSVALMKGNAALFNNRVPDSGAAGEDL